VTEAAAVGTPAVGYDVPGVRDSVSLSGGWTVAPRPDALAEFLIQALPDWMHSPPDVAPQGVTSWLEVAETLLALANLADSSVARDSRSSAESQEALEHVGPGFGSLSESEGRTSLAD